MNYSQTSTTCEKEKEDSYIALVKEGGETQSGSEANSSGESIEVVDDKRHVVVFGKLCSRQEVSVCKFLEHF